MFSNANRDPSDATKMIQAAKEWLYTDSYDTDADDAFKASMLNLGVTNPDEIITKMGPECGGTTIEVTLGDGTVIEIDTETGIVGEIK